MIIILGLIAFICTKLIINVMQYLVKVHYYLIIQWENVNNNEAICNKYVLFVFVYMALLVSEYIFVGNYIQKILMASILLVFIQIWFMDIKYRFIFDESIYFLLSINVLWILFEHITLATLFYKMLIMGIVFIIMLLLAIILRGGLGGGDVKFVAVMAFLFGVEKTISMLMIAFILGGLVAIFLILIRKRSTKDFIAYGPYLILGAIVQLFY